MARTKSAKKAERVSKRRRVFNVRRKKAVHDSRKKTARAIGAGKQAEAAKTLPELYKALDKAAKHGTISKNTAARLKSRASKHVATLSK